MNQSLHTARAAKADEFYTRLADIEKELRHYRRHFKGKRVLCNCDDPATSNFPRYFAENFDDLGLQSLASSYIDFRSPEAVALLREADIVVTNPPFSLFREYIAQLIEHGKQFLIIGSLNVATYKEVFPLFKEGRLWMGVTGGSMAFRVPDSYEPRKTRYWQAEDGQKWRSLGNSYWFTNLHPDTLRPPLALTRAYDPETYPTYDNYDAINVDRVADIPVDYDGEMGVPITFLLKHNPKQFEIVGIDRQLTLAENGKTSRFFIEGREIYARIIIRRKP